MFRVHLGLPADFDIIEDWLADTIPHIRAQQRPLRHYVKKCPEIPTLATYTRPPPPSFWNYFPKNTSITTVHTPVKGGILKQYIQLYQNRWAFRQRAVAKLAVENILTGTKVKLKSRLPPVTCKNATSATRNGAFMTDTIANWVKSKFVSGPFSEPPLPNFRTNMLLAKEEKAKLRPIINLSAPKGASFNEAVDTTTTLKLTMCSPAIFSQVLLHAGKNALFAKADLQNAYKLIPVNPEDWHFFGFKWLGKHFYETNTAFGNTEAPAEFDPLPETVVALTKIIANTPDYWVLRQLDDTLIVSPCDTNHTVQFIATFNVVCNNLGIPLAPLCPKFEKAFSATTRGTVLGVIFDSKTLTWNLPQEKVDESLLLLQKVMNQATCTLLQFQKLHGKLNDFAQMCIFMKGFKFQQNKFLRQLHTTDQKHLPLPILVRRELQIWAKCIAYATNGLPIPTIRLTPPLCHLSFISDAAGAAYTYRKGHRIHISKPGDRGVASLGMLNSTFFFVAIVKWPMEFLAKYGTQSSVFEAVGLLLPFMAIPSQLRNKHILLLVDNEAFAKAWLRRVAKYNETMAIFVQTLHLIEALLPCRIYIHYLKRCSTTPAKVVDQLSRESTTTKTTWQQIDYVTPTPVVGPLLEWLQHPSPDWQLPYTLLNFVKSQLP